MLTNERVLIGPFTQALSLSNLALQGPLSDDQLEVISDAGVILTGSSIERVGTWSELKTYASHEEIKVRRIEEIFAQLGDPARRI